MWPRQKMRDHFFAVDEALQLVPFGVVPAAAVAVREVVRVQILNGGRVCFAHDEILELGTDYSTPKLLTSVSKFGDFPQEFGGVSTSPDFHSWGGRHGFGWLTQHSDASPVEVEGQIRNVLIDYCQTCGLRYGSGICIHE